MLGFASLSPTYKRDGDGFQIRPLMNGSQVGLNAMKPNVEQAGYEQARRLGRAE